MAEPEPVLIGNRNDGFVRPLPPDMAARLRDYVGIGSTGLVELLPCGKVVRKSPHPHVSPWMKNNQRKELQREFEIYQRLPPHPRLVRMLGFSDDIVHGDRGLLLEYMPQGDLRRLLRSDADIPIERRLRWCSEAAEAVAVLHTHGVIHADIRPDNMLLDQEFRLRLIDLCGSIDGKETLALESARFFLPRNTKVYPRCDVTTDLFALGSSFYEIVTGKPPFADIGDEEVEARYARKEFPLVKDLALGDVMQGCWMEEYGSAAEVLAAVETEVKKIQAE